MMFTVPLGPSSVSEGPFAVALGTDLNPGNWVESMQFVMQLACRLYGFSPAEAEEIGLLISRKSGSGFYDRFRNRLMFPICDLHGRVIAFSGRALEERIADKHS